MRRTILRTAALMTLTGATCLAGSLIIDTTINNTLMNNVQGPTYTLQTGDNGNLEAQNKGLLNGGASATVNLSSTWTVDTAILNPPKLGISVQSATLTLSLSSPIGSAQIARDTSVANSYLNPNPPGNAFAQSEPFLPNLSETIGAISVTIEAGSGASHVSYSTSLTGTTSINLVSHNFRDLLDNGAPLTITYTAPDTITILDAKNYNQKTCPTGPCTELVILKDTRTATTHEVLDMQYDPVPEPGTLVLLLSAIGAAGAWRIANKEGSR